MSNLTRPQAGQPLSNPDGPTVMDEYADAIEAAEATLSAAQAAIAAAEADIAEAQADIAVLQAGGSSSGSSEVVYSSAFPELAAEPLGTLPTNDVLSNASGAWSATGGFSGAVATVDTVTKTTGLGSISADLSLPGGAGTTDGKLIFTPASPIPLGGHTDFDIDVRWTGVSGSPGSYLAFEVFVASGGNGTGTVVAKTMGVAAPTENTWTTVSLHVANSGIASVGSFGIRKKSTSSSAPTKHVIFKVDRPEWSATTSLDTSMTTSPRTLVVTPGYSTGLTQGLLTLGTTQSLLDLRPSNTNLSRFRGVKNFRDWQLDETGAADVTAEFQAIINSLQPGDLLQAPPTAVYRVDGHIDIAVSDVTIDMQGARIFASAWVGNGDTMFSLIGDYCTLLRWRIFGRPPNVTTNGNLLASVAGQWIPNPDNKTPPTETYLAGTASGTTMTFDARKEAARIAVRPSGGAEELMTERYARDEHGYIQFDISARASVAGLSTDCLVTVTNHDGTIVDYQTTLPLTTTQTTYPVKFRPHDPFARTRLTISKATSTTNTITVHSVLAYRRYSYLPGNPPNDFTLNNGMRVNGSGCVIEDFWAEGMGGDGLNVRGNDNCGLRVRKFFARANGRENIAVLQGKDILIEDFVCAGSARDSIDIEPETDASAISNLRFRNGIIGTGRNIAFVCSGGDRSSHISFEDIWLRVDSGGAWKTDFEHGGVIRNLLYTYEGPPTETPKGLEIHGKGMMVENIESDGGIFFGADDSILRGAKIKSILYEEPGTTGDIYTSLIVDGVRDHVQDITIGDPQGPPVTVDTNIAFKPVQLAADTTYSNIQMPLWQTSFGNTYKSKVATQLPWLPRGADLLGSGIRQLRGLSASTVPANNLCGSAAVAPNATSLVIGFPNRSDVKNPSSFTLTATGPTVLKLTSDEQAGGPNIGTWTVTYNGQVSVPISAYADAAELQAALNGLSNLVPGDVVVSGTTDLYVGGAQGGLTLTWNVLFGDLPLSLFSVQSSIISAKGNLRTIVKKTVVTGGFMVSSSTVGQYWYRVAGRTFEGQPLAGLTAKKLILPITNNAITVSTAGIMDLAADLKTAGITVWRAGPFTNDGATTYSGNFDKRVDLPGSVDLAHSTSGTDRETTFSGVPWVSGTWTTAEISLNQSGWEPDTNYNVVCVPSTPTAPWDARLSVTAKTRAGFTANFTAAPANATIDWVLARKP